MEFDVCLVTYNSAKWLDQCIFALSRAAIGNQINIFLADNASTDQTLTKAKHLAQQYAQSFGCFKIIPQNHNRGFGAGCNAAAAAGNGSYVFFCNVDTEIFENAFCNLEKAIKESDSSFSAFEMRQIPYEHPKFYNPATLETAWASGACVAVQRDAFEKVGGFDENIFMYGEDVELSFHLRAMGYRIQYVPQACIRHYAYATPGEVKPIQVEGSLLINLYLRYKYGTKTDIKHWDELFFNARGVFSADEKTRDISDIVEQKERQLRKLGRKQRGFYKNIVVPSSFDADWNELDYGFARAGAFCIVEPIEENVSFSVLMRAHKRADRLALALASLCRQTYKKFEVVLVEDGEAPVCGQIVKQFENKLKIRYIPLNRQEGRCAAGNVAMQAAATGEFFVFLNDDDFFFADHLETLAHLIQKNPQCKMVASGAVEAKRDGDQPLQYGAACFAHHKVTHYSLARQCMDNCFAIQCVAFHKSLPQEYGGLDENLNMLENWDLWTRYACHTSVAVSEKETSLYHVPADPIKRAQSKSEIMPYYRELLKKWEGYSIDISASDLLITACPPEKAKKEVEDYTQYLSLQKTIEDIEKSESWKLSKPLRSITGKLIDLLDKLKKRLDKSYPQSPKETTKENNARMAKFVADLQQSAYWRAMNFIKGKLHF